MATNSSQLAATLAALYQKRAAAEADLDYEKQAKLRQNAAALKALDVQKPLSIKAGNEALADRGLAQSGIGLGAINAINRNYLTNTEAANTSLNDDMADITRRRQKVVSEYDADVAEANRSDVFGQPVVPKTPPTPTKKVVTPTKPTPKKKPPAKTNPRGKQVAV